MAPGVYDQLPMEWYHDDCCAGPSISAGGLETILKCPVKYWAFSPLNPNRFPPTDTKPMAIGRAAHALALGEPKFSDAFVVLPEDAPRRPTKLQINAKKPSPETLAAIAFWNDINSRTETIIAFEDYELVKLMAHALKIAPQVANAFIDGKPEQSLIWKDKETGIWLKSRPDWLPNAPKKQFVVDYKTALTIDPYRLSNHAFDYGFHIQGALQVDAVEQVLGTRPLGIAHVCQEKDPPFLAELRMFTPEQIEIGRKAYRRALRTFADCLSSGKWPGYTKDPTYFQTPYRVAMESDEFEPKEPRKGRRHEPHEYLETL